MTKSAFDKNVKQPLAAGENQGRDFDLVDNAEDLDFLRGLYPKLSTDQLLELKERLDGYFEVALEASLERYPKDSVDDSKMSF
jgi:hypothetical protein